MPRKASISRSELVTGKSTAQILSLSNKEFNKLTETELRHYVTRIASAGNKRLRGFEKAGEKSPAYSRAMELGRFTARGKNLAELRQEYSRIRDFMQNKYSTVAKWKPLKQKLIKGLTSAGVGVNDGNFYPLFDTYNKLRELDPTITYQEWKYEIMKEIDSTIDEVREETDNWDDLTEEERANITALAMNDKLDEIVTKREEIRRKADSTSDFFEMGGY